MGGVGGVRGAKPLGTLTSSTSHVSDVVAFLQACTTILTTPPRAAAVRAPLPTQMTLRALVSLMLLTAAVTAQKTSFVVPLNILGGITPRGQESVAAADDQILVAAAQAVPAESADGTKYWDMNATISKAVEARLGTCNASTCHGRLPRLHLELLLHLMSACILMSFPPAPPTAVHPCCRQGERKSPDLQRVVRAWLPLVELVRAHTESAVQAHAGLTGP